MVLRRSSLAVDLRHLLRQAGDPHSQRLRLDDPDVRPEAEDPGDELGAVRREAHLDALDRIFLLHADAEAVGEDALRIVAVLVGRRSRGI